MSRGGSDETVDVIVLAGGRARRMGGVDKPALTVGGRSLLTRALDATATTARHVVVVGPHRAELDNRILQTREQPEGSGPVAAIAAGLAVLPQPAADVVVVLAADLPFVDEAAVRSVVTELKSNSATFAVDASGRIQYLFGAWRGVELRRRLDALPDTADRAVRSIVPGDSGETPVSTVGDCDTPADLAAAREHAAMAVSDEQVPTVDEARELIRRRIAPMTTTAVAVADAAHAVLAEPIVAVTPLPPVALSAMDGYAVSGPGPWSVRDDIAFAGTSGHNRLEPGEAVRIATGAHVPDGATAVVRDEHVVHENARLNRAADAPIRDDTRAAGEDWPAGTELVAAGTAVSAAVQSVALSAEVRRLVVRGPVRARIVVSGNEIRSEGPLATGQTRDSVGPVLPRYLEACGIGVTDTVHLDDSPTAFEELLAHPTDAHVVVVVGATGGGAADQLRTALVRADATIVVQRTSVRPGGSQVTAVLADGTVILGLPGNPLAAVSTVMLTAPAVVDALTARAPSAPILGYLSNSESAVSPVARIVPVTRDGAYWRLRDHVRTAHLLHLVDHDALALVRANLTPGEPVELLPLPR